MPPLGGDGVGVGGDGVGVGGEGVGVGGEGVGVGGEGVGVGGDGVGVGGDGVGVGGEGVGDGGDVTVKSPAGRSAIPAAFTVTGPVTAFAGTGRRSVLVVPTSVLCKF
jgi:hypothetical protein